MASGGGFVWVTGAMVNTYHLEAGRKDEAWLWGGTEDHGTSVDVPDRAFLAQIGSVS